VLSLPTPLLAVSDRDTTDGSTTADFFARLTDLGFTCLAFGPPRRRIRRTEVVCTRGDGGGEWFGYAGGWPKGGSVFIVDRIRVGRSNARTISSICTASLVALKASVSPSSSVPADRSPGVSSM